MVTGGEEEVTVLGHLISGRRGAQRSSLGGKHPGSSSLIRESHKQLLSRCQKVKHARGAALPITRASCCSVVKIPGNRPGSREVSLAQLLRKLPAMCPSLQQCWASALLCYGGWPSAELLSELRRADTSSEQQHLGQAHRECSCGSHIITQCSSSNERRQTCASSTQTWASSTELLSLIRDPTGSSSSAPLL